MTTRWVLNDPATSETYVFPFNPNQMTSPHRPDSSKYFTASPVPMAQSNVGSYAPVLQGKRDPYEWSFSGVIRDKEQHDAMLRWFTKKTLVDLTDHLGRTWRVRFTALTLDERKPTPRHPWRFDYTMTTLMHGQVTS